MNNEEFYIGWLPQAPKTFARFVRKYIFILLPIVILIGVALALSQKKFSTGTFEFGTLTEVKGIYSSTPIANIKVITGKDIWGNTSSIIIPLVGYGKSGADGVIADYEREKKYSLNQKEVTLKGTLLYNDGKTILQIDGNDKPVVNVSANTVSAELLPKTKDLGSMKVSGEIIDPKCYFGVMKPGEGKPHKDCAIRCILGGVSPMLAVHNDKGEANYYMLVGPHGEKMNKAVQDFVAEPVSIDARVVQYDDWIVLYVNSPEGINRISFLDLVKPGADLIACTTNCK